MVEKPFKKVGPIEYEVQLGGRTKTLKVPFNTTQAIFSSFISSGGVIDPVSGEVQQDILSLITSFKAVGDILLTEHDEEGKVTVEGNCSTLSAEDVIVLFQLASEIIQDFIQRLTQMNPSNQSQPPSEEVKKAKSQKA